MQICPSCNHENPDDVPICLNCASALLFICENCGARVPKGNKFCGQCGQKIREGGSPESQIESPLNPKLEAQQKMLMSLQAKMPSTMINKISRSAPEMIGSRREVTVLFVDIVDFTIASRELGSETTYLVIDEVMHMLADVVYRYEGTIDKFSGDGLMALFGVPINHENDPERAVRAALDMQIGMRPIQKRLLNQYQFEFNIRIGINTGPVIVGPLGNDHHLEYTVIGNTVNLASRLEKTTAPGSVLVSFQTYQRTRPIINYQSIAAQNVKGFTGPVKPYQAMGIRIKPGQIRGVPGLQVPIVGRREDISHMLEQFKKASKNLKCAVSLCSGEAGIGKTRLVSEFCTELTDGSVSVYRGTCASYMRITPYRVVADMIRNMIQVSEMDSEAYQQESLRLHLEANNMDIEETLPYLLHVFGLPQLNHVSDARLKLLDPDMLQRQTHSTLRKLFIAQAAFSPVVLIYDDLHWIDQASRDFFVYFVQSVADLPLYIIFIARDFKKDPMLDPLVEAVKKETINSLDIQLEPLSNEDSRLLVDQLIQETTEHANHLKQEMTERAKGNPYFTEEIVRVLIDQGGITNHDGVWRVTQKAISLIQDVPGTLQDIILARFDRLPGDTKQLLQRAAVFGQSFPTRLLQEFAGIDNDTLFNNLRSLVSRDYLNNVQFGIEDGYIFKHPLLQDVIYNTLLKRDLRKLHLQLGEIIENGGYWLPAEQDEILAYHYDRSNQPEKAVSYLLASAEKAAHRFANESVIQHYRRAIEIMEKIGGNNSIEFDQAKVGLGQALKFTGEFDEAVLVLESVLSPVLDTENLNLLDNEKKMEIYAEGLREIGDIRTREGKLEMAEMLLTKGLHLLGDSGEAQLPSQWRRLVDRLAWVYFRQGKLEEAFNQADLALYDLETWEADDPITLASLSNTLGGIYWTRSRNTDAILNVERSLNIFQSLNYAWGMAIAYTNLGVLHVTMGKWLEAIGNFEQADAIQREFGYIPERPTNLKNFGEVLVYSGDHDQAREKFELGRDIAHHLGMDIAEAYVEMGLCRLAIIENKFEKAVIHLENSRQLLEPTRDQVNERNSHLLILTARVKAMGGDIEGGLPDLEQAYNISLQGGFPSGKLEALRVLGITKTKLFKFEEAEEHLQNYIEFANAQNDNYKKAQGLHALSELFISWGGGNPLIQAERLKKSRQAINEALGLFEMLGAKFDLHQAQITRNKISQIDPLMSTQANDRIELNDQISSMRTQLGLPDGEWFPAVVLFVQVVPSGEADIEFVFETITIFTPPLLEIFEEYGGQVIRQQDGMTVIFGAPAAHEDDPERAIEVAIKVVNFYQEFYKQTELPVSIRMGVSMGRVVAGRVDRNFDGEYIAAGEPILEAKTVATAAPFSRVWVTGPVRNTTSYRFEYSTVSRDLLSNFQDIAIHQLEGIREQIRPVRGLLGLKAPFVGRQAEMSALIDLSQGLERSEGGLIWIEGDPGIGKSRLMREFIGSYKPGKIQFWMGACNIRRADYAFSLFTDLLGNAFDLQSTYPVEQIYTIIDQKLDAWTVEADDLRPFIQLLCGVQPTGIHGEQLLNLEPEQLRRQTFVAVRKVIEIVSKAKPLVIILDDIQWVDPVSADLLFFLTSLILEQSLLIISAKRSGEPSKSEKTLTRIQQLHPDKTLSIPLKPLNSDECGLLLDQFFSTTEISESLTQLIVQQSGGNPYFIEEFIRMLVEQGYLQVIRGQLEVNQAFEIDSLSVPSSLETLIRARVDALQSPVRNLLQVASVIGQRFHNHLLEWISGQKEGETRLRLLQNRGMLKSTGEDGYWEFSHPLIETVVYNTVLKAQRKILHQRTATALEIQWHGNEEEHAEDLAYHFQKAEDHEKALNYLILAGERSAFRHANEAALEYFEEAEKLIEKLPGTSSDKRFRVTIGLGEVYQFVGNFDASIEVLEAELNRDEGKLLRPIQRAGLYRCIGETILKKEGVNNEIPYFDLGLDALGTITDEATMAEAAMLLERKGWHFFMEAKLEEARKSGERAQDFAQKAGSLRALAKIENLLGGTLYRQGELDQAVTHVRKAMEYWERMGYTWGVAATLSNLGILEVGAGNWDSALNFFQQSLDLRREIGDVEGVVIAHNNLGMLALEKGDMLLAETHFRNCLSVAKPFQIAWQTANATMGVAQALFYQGKTNEAEVMLQEGMVLANEIGARDLTSEMGRTQAEILLAKDSADAAFRAAKNAAILAQEIGNSLMESGAWRVAARCQLQMGQFESALISLEKAWEAVGKIEDEVETGRVNAQAYHIFIALGENEKAVRYREIAVEIFSRLGASRDLVNLEITEG